MWRTPPRVRASPGSLRAAFFFSPCNRTPCHRNALKTQGNGQRRGYGRTGPPGAEICPITAPLRPPFHRYGHRFGSSVSLINRWFGRVKCSGKTSRWRPPGTPPRPLRAGKMFGAFIGIYTLLFNPRRREFIGVVIGVMVGFVGGRNVARTPPPFLTSMY